MNKLWEYIKLALEGLKADKKRTVLTTLGIVVGIASVIIINTFGTFVSDMLKKSNEADLLGQNIQIKLIDAEAKDDGDDASISDTVIDPADYITDEMISQYKSKYGTSIVGIEQSSELNSYGKVKSGLQEQKFKLTGINGDYSNVKAVNITMGRSIMDRDDEGTKNVIVISSDLSKKLYGENAYPIGQKLAVETNYGTRDLYVIGVFSKKLTESSREFAYIPMATANDISGSVSTGYPMITVMVKNSEDLKAFMNKTSSFFSSWYKGKTCKVSVQEEKEVQKKSQDSFQMISTMLTIIGGISLLVGGIGVMNVMLISVTERTREIGIRKALGAPNSAIQIQFIVESMIMCLAGGIIGMAIGFAAVYITFALFLNTSFTIHPEFVLIAIGFSMAIGVFFGVYPANRSARLNPIEALRYE